MKSNPQFAVNVGVIVYVGVTDIVGVTVGVIVIVFVGVNVGVID